MNPFSYGTVLNASSGEIPTRLGWIEVKSCDSPIAYTSSFQSFSPIIADIFAMSSPKRAPMIFLSKNIVNPSFSQKSLQLLIVTKFPLHECEISCAITSARDLSPATIEGVANVRHGFSIPPNGNEGGRTKMLYSPHS